MMNGVNIDRLMDLINEENDSYYAYAKSGKVYYNDHGYGMRLDKPVKTKEEQYIEYCYHDSNRARSVVVALFEVLNFDKDQIHRAYDAARAVRKWYNKTEWQRCLPYDLIERIGKYIYG